MIINGYESETMNSTRRFIEELSMSKQLEKNLKLKIC